MIDYKVPRSLDVPDRIGVPFFTTAQVFLFLAGLALAVLAWNQSWDVNLKAWLCVWVPMLFLLGPRRFGDSGWTVFQQAWFRVGRALRPKKTLWRA